MIQYHYKKGMKRFSPYAITLVVFTIVNIFGINCSSSSDDSEESFAYSKEEFQKIKDSIESANEILGNRTKYINSAISKFDDCLALIRKDQKLNALFKKFKKEVRGFNNYITYNLVEHYNFIYILEEMESHIDNKLKKYSESDDNTENASDESESSSNSQTENIKNKINVENEAMPSVDEKLQNDNTKEKSFQEITEIYKI